MLSVSLALLSPLLPEADKFKMKLLENQNFVRKTGGMLPVKCLLRFKCVSKLWLRIISDPGFEKYHYERTAARTHKLLSIPSSASDVRSIDPDASLHDESVSAALNLHFLPPNAEILLNRRFLYFPFLYGFVYDPSTNDHMVVLSCNFGSDASATGVEVFSLRANMWIQTEALYYGNDVPNNFRVESLLNGAIHWLISFLL
ncbi:uncharacterized protein LOC113874655 [Abrus precatorius]|uniref:Uncharacterized protein LOC113874655 n=1 Tax=Abrus precatorius TaxID=3816 RepID=A0A8B8MIW4_ABRPR|nr:uncharacterized protein LOC113874655 [Abrus precatorius]